MAEELNNISQQESELKTSKSIDEVVQELLALYYVPQAGLYSKSLKC